MGVAAILVMWPRCSEQTFVCLNYWGSIWNLALIGPMVSEKKRVEEFSLYESMWKKWPLGRGHFLPQGYNLNNLHRGPQDKATYQISKALVVILLSQREPF